SVSADYCFSCGCDEPVRAGDGRPDAVPDTADLAAAAGLPGGAGPRFGADTVERVEPSGMPARLRDRCRSARRPPDPVRDRRPALGAVAILLGRGHPRGQRRRPLLGARLLSAGLSRHGGAGVILPSALQAIGLFIATNIDDLIVLPPALARAAGQRPPTARMLSGQYLGCGGILASAPLVAIGGDNIGVYVPVFLNVGTGAVVASCIVFLVLVAGLVGLAKFVATRRPIAEVLERWEHILFPTVLIGLGAFILISGGAFGL